RPYRYLLSFPTRRSSDLLVRCQRPRPARSRSTCCASESGRDARNGSTSGFAARSFVAHERKRPVDYDPDILGKDLVIPRAVQRVGLTDPNSLRERAGRRRDPSTAENSALILRDAGRSLHLELHTGARAGGHYDSRLIPSIIGTPGTLVGDNGPALIDVDMFAE